MKKYLSVLIVGMVCFCVIAGITASGAQNTPLLEKSMYHPEFLLSVKGGIGVSLILTNTGNETFNGTISGNITVHDCVVVFGKTKTIPSQSYTIGVGESITIKHFPIGLGSAIITSHFEIENVSVIDSEAFGFLFLFFVLFS